MSGLNVSPVQCVFIMIQQVSIFIDYFQDESYTPKHISIRGGTNDRDLHASIGALVY